MLPHPPEYILEKACCARVRLQGAVLQGLALAGVFVEREKKGKQDADGKKNPAQPIPGQPSLAGESPEHDGDNIGEPQSIGRGEEHLVDRAARHGGGIGAQAQMKEEIGQGRQNKGDLFPYRTHIMNNSIACVFPETLPTERFLLPLVQVFGQVVYMQAVENAPPEQRTATAFTERCRQQGRLRTFTPAPLGDQRERFLALARDIRRRGETYISQLSMATLAGLGRRDHPESAAAILSGLLRGADIREQEQTMLMLWQSRLMIELGESYDIEQAELHSALGAIAQRQDSLFAELREEENFFVVPVAGQDHSTETDSILRHRLRAWTRLCFHHNLPAPGLLVCHHHAAVDLLQEVYERKWGQSARLLASLAIPKTSAQATDVGESPGQKCPALDRLLAAIAADGSRLRPSAEDELLWQAGLAEWSRVAAGLAASPPTEPAVLDLFSFPQVSPARLFAESFTGAVASAGNGEEDAGCVVGLLRTP